VGDGSTMRLRAAHAPVIEYPAPSRRPIVVHVRDGDADK
jgi:hypothetical protein